MTVIFVYYKGMNHECDGFEST